MVQREDISFKEEDFTLREFDGGAKILAIKVFLPVKEKRYKLITGEDGRFYPNPKNEECETTIEVYMRELVEYPKNNFKRSIPEALEWFNARFQDILQDGYMNIKDGKDGESYTIRFDYKRFDEIKSRKFDPKRDLKKQS